MRLQVTIYQDLLTCQPNRIDRGIGADDEAQLHTLPEQEPALGCD